MNLKMRLERGGKKGKKKLNSRTEWMMIRPRMIKMVKMVKRRKRSHLSWNKHRKRVL